MIGVVARRAALPLALAAMQIHAAASAHDFWIQPDSFRIEPGATGTLVLQVGHGEDRRRSPISRGRIVRFVAVGPDGREIDFGDGLDLGGEHSDGTFRLARPGAYLLILETDDRALSRLPADRFNAHLEAEGLTPAIELRRRTGRAGAAGTETYGRRAKAIVLVGAPPPEAHARLALPAGLALEIVTETSPSLLPPGAPLPVRVYYRGAPLAGALVRLTGLEPGSAPLARQRTDASGRTSFAVPRPGAWLLSATWTRPLPAGAEADFETLFSSLSFAVP